MMKALAMTLVMCPMVSFGMDRLAALSMIETGNNDRMVGRAGEISRYQILKREWRSVTNSTRYTDPATAKAVTLKLINRRVQAFQSVYNRQPTNFEFYALWNAPTQVLENRISRVVAERCRRYSNLCEWNGVPTPARVAATRPVQRPPSSSKSAPGLMLCQSR